MAQTIDSQVMSLKVQKYLNSAQEHANKSTERLASGLRVNSANDDAAGLAIAERMNSEVRGMNVGIRNAYDGISMSQTAEGGLKQVHTTLQRMRELALQSSNGTYTDADRQHLNAEFSALNEEVSRIASTTTFNGEAVLDSNGKSVNFQLGAGAEAADSLDVNMTGVESLSANISTAESSLASIDMIDSLIADVSSARSYYGAMQTRFESTISNLQVGVQNQSAARGRIMDADYALETAMLARSQILQQAGSAMSAQANATPQSVLQLLG